MTEISRTLKRPVDAAGLAAFRVGFGLLMLIAVLRFFVHGWIDEYFLAPKHFFSYWGFDWVRPWPAPWMHLHFVAMGLCALGIMLGYRYRASCIGFGLLFAYAHLIDKTNYLNHYYLIICVSGLMACMPLDASWSLDARRDASRGRAWLPAWMLWALRAQFACVYLFGGLAKLKPDWLFRGEPLATWLARSADVPILGSFSDQHWLALGMSWAGAAFDLGVVPLLLWRRTRPFAYLALASFHLLTARLFQLGMFPYVMLWGSLLFLDPSWPRRLLPRRWSPAQSPARPAALSSPAWLAPLLSGYFALQLLVPLRHFLYPGNVCWTEQGFRFSWNVMLMEKDGAVDFRVVDPASGRRFHVSPLEYFTRYQTKMMAPQPDMVLEAAHVVAADFRARGVQAPQVYADVFVSLNGRPMQRLIDPRVDLAPERDGLASKDWILPLGEQPRSEAAEAVVIAGNKP